MTTMEEEQLFAPGTLLQLTRDLAAIRGNQQGWSHKDGKLRLSKLSNEMFVYVKTQGNLPMQGVEASGILLLRGDGTLLWLWYSPSLKSASYIRSWFTVV